MWATFFVSPSEARVKSVKSDLIPGGMPTLASEAHEAHEAHEANEANEANEAYNHQLIFSQFFLKLTSNINENERK